MGGPGLVLLDDIDETLGNYIKFCALCIYLFDYMHSSVDVEL